MSLQEPMSANADSLVGAATNPIHGGLDPQTGQPSGPVEVWRFGVVSGEIESLGVIYTPAEGYTTLPNDALSRGGSCEP